MDFLGLSLLGTFRGYSSLLSQMVCLKEAATDAVRPIPPVFHRKPVQPSPFVFQAPRLGICLTFWLLLSEVCF